MDDSRNGNIKPSLFKRKALMDSFSVNFEESGDSSVVDSPTSGRVNIFKETLVNTTYNVKNSSSSDSSMDIVKRDDFKKPQDLDISYKDHEDSFAKRPKIFDKKKKDETYVVCHDASSVVSDGTFELSNSSISVGKTLFKTKPNVPAFNVSEETSQNSVSGETLSNSISLTEVGREKALFKNKKSEEAFDVTEEISQNSQEMSSHSGSAIEDCGGKTLFKSKLSEAAFDVSQEESQNSMSKEKQSHSGSAMEGSKETNLLPNDQSMPNWDVSQEVLQSQENAQETTLTLSGPIQKHNVLFKNEKNDSSFNVDLEKSKDCSTEMSGPLENPKTLFKPKNKDASFLVEKDASSTMERSIEIQPVTEHVQNKDDSVSDMLPEDDILTQENQNIGKIKTSKLFKKKSLNVTFDVGKDMSSMLDTPQTLHATLKATKLFKKKKVQDNTFDVSHNESSRMDESHMSDMVRHEESAGTCVSRASSVRNLSADSTCSPLHASKMSNGSVAAVTSVDSSLVVDKSTLEVPPLSEMSGNTLTYDEANTSTVSGVPVHESTRRGTPLQKNQDSKMHSDQDDASLNKTTEDLEKNKTLHKMSDIGTDNNETLSKDLPGKLKLFKQRNKREESYVVNHDASSELANKTFNMTETSNLRKSLFKKKANQTGTIFDVGQEPSQESNNTDHISQQELTESYNDDNLDVWMSDEENETQITKNSIPAEEPTSDTPCGATTSLVKTPLARPTVRNNTKGNTENEWEIEAEEIIKNAKKKAVLKPNYNFSSTPSRKQKQPLHQKPQMENIFKKPRLKKPAKFATQQFYNFLIKKLEPNFGLDTNIKSEEIMCYLADVVKCVTKRQTHQKSTLDKLKQELARSGVIETTNDFYDLVRKFLPTEFRYKVIPCVQPITNITWPPKDLLNPFDKIPF